MKAYVIDASIAVKWIVDKSGTTDALALRGKARLIAPELLVAECANILWKKVRRNELSKEQALLAARLLEGADVELLSTRSLLDPQLRSRSSWITQRMAACTWPWPRRPIAAL